MKFRYDKRDNKVFKICAIVFTALFAVSFLFAWLEPRELESTVIIATAGLLLVACLPLMIVCWYAYADSLVYIKKLEDRGISVPYNKKLQPVYNGDPAYTEEEKDDTGSRVMSYICVAVAAVQLIFIVVYVAKWTALNVKDCKAMIFFLAGPAIFWLIGAAAFNKQRSNEKYRDETVNDPGRKKRKSVPESILTIIICLVLTGVVDKTVVNMTDYVYRSRLDAIYESDYRLHIGERLPD